MSPRSTLSSRFDQPEQIGRQSSRIRWQCGPEPFGDLGADCLAVDAADLNAGMILAGHEGVHWLGTKSQNGNWFIADRKMRQMKLLALVAGLGRRYRA
jgi:hypothetical protein